MDEALQADASVVFRVPCLEEDTQQKALTYIFLPHFISFVFCFFFFLLEAVVVAVKVVNLMT